MGNLENKIKEEIRINPDEDYSYITLCFLISGGIMCSDETIRPIGYFLIAGGFLMPAYDATLIAYNKALKLYKKIKK